MLKTCGWISRCPWNPHWLMPLIWWVYRSTGAHALTKFRKELPSSWLRGKAYILACCDLCVACTASCEQGFVMAGHVGKEFAASKGMFQGCLLSVLFSQPYHEHLSQIRGSRKFMLTTLMLCFFFFQKKKNVMFCQSHTAKLNVEKTQILSSSARDFVLDVVNRLIASGILLRCAEGMSKAVAQDRVRKCITVSRRIR